MCDLHVCFDQAGIEADSGVVLARPDGDRVPLRRRVVLLLDVQRGNWASDDKGAIEPKGRGIVWYNPFTQDLYIDQDARERRRDARTGRRDDG